MDDRVGLISLFLLDIAGSNPALCSIFKKILIINPCVLLVFWSGSLVLHQVNKNYQVQDRRAQTTDSAQGQSATSQGRSPERSLWSELTIRAKLTIERYHVVILLLGILIVHVVGLEQPSKHEYLHSEEYFLCRMFQILDLLQHEFLVKRSHTHVS